MSSQLSWSSEFFSLSVANTEQLYRAEAEQHFLKDKHKHIWIYLKEKCNEWKYILIYRILGCVIIFIMENLSWKWYGLHHYVIMHLSVQSLYNA